MDKGSTPPVIRVKGRSPEYKYNYSFPEIFDALGVRVFSVQECISLLNKKDFFVDEQALLQNLFNYRRNPDINDADGLPFSFAGPFQMRSVVHGQLNFNLHYQDAVIKIELEKMQSDGEHIFERNAILKDTFEIVSIILKTAFFSNEPLYLELTNMELDHIVIECLGLLWPGKQNQQDAPELVTAGHIGNLIAWEVQRRFLSTVQMDLENILPFLLYSGVVWWSDHDIQERYQSDHDRTIQVLFDQLSGLVCQPLTINDFPAFNKEVLEFKPHKKLLYFLDDNGEVVWGLLFVRLLLDANPNLVIFCVVNEIPVTNNCNITTVMGYLKSNGAFLNLLHDPRFQLVGEANKLPAIDLRFISSHLREYINWADIFLINGVSFYEKLQFLSNPTYYLFTVYSETSKILTGFDQNAGIFARLGAHLCGFSHVQDDFGRAKPKMTLKDIYSSLQSPTYKNFVNHFENESKANLWLLDASIRKNLTLDEVINQLGTTSI